MYPEKVAEVLRELDLYYETINDAKFLQPWEFDRRDYLAGNVLKGLENLKPPKAFKWDILSTYDQ